MNAVAKLGDTTDQELARLAKAVAHPARVRILRMLSQKEPELCGEIVREMPRAQSTVSEHLRILKAAGLVRSSQDGPTVKCWIDGDNLKRFEALVENISGIFARSHGRRHVAAAGVHR